MSSCCFENERKESGALLFVNALLFMNRALYLVFEGLMFAGHSFCIVLHANMSTPEPPEKSQWL